MENEIPCKRGMPIDKLGFVNGKKMWKALRLVSRMCVVSVFVVVKVHLRIYVGVSVPAIKKVVARNSTRNPPSPDSIFDSKPHFNT